MELGMAATLARTNALPLKQGVREHRCIERRSQLNPAPSLFNSKGASSESDSNVARRYDCALEEMLSHRGNPAAEIDRILADHPRSVFAHCLRAALIVRNDDHAAKSSVAASIAAIAKARLSRDDPARRHAAAASSWLDGNPPLTLERYGAIVAEQPRDSLAIAVAHALDFRLGQRRMLRDRIAPAISHWDASMLGYPAILAMYAFGLEENGEFRQAESLARRALAINPGHAPAIHVVAHVMEMEGRAREGLSFLAANEAAWAEGTDLSVHLAWHRALLYLQVNDLDSALRVYDLQIAGAMRSELSALADASALLWRLKLRNLELGERWRILAKRWENAPLLGARPFYIVHAIMAFAGSGRMSAAADLRERVPYLDTNVRTQDLPEDALVHPVANALIAFAAGDYHTSAALLERVRNIADRCGGSLAQCEVVRLTFSEAALRAEKANRKVGGDQDSGIRDLAMSLASSGGLAVKRQRFSQGLP
jgi:tetratricopeptide (TPR) repeat protein